MGTTLLPARTATTPPRDKNGNNTAPGQNGNNTAPGQNGNNTAPGANGNDTAPGGKTVTTPSRGANGNRDWGGRYPHAHAYTEAIPHAACPSRAVTLERVMRFAVSPHFAIPPGSRSPGIIYSPRKSACSLCLRYCSSTLSFPPNLGILENAWLAGCACRSVCCAKFISTRS